jgi:hypothetical protein
MKKKMSRPLQRFGWIALFSVTVWACQDNDSPSTPVTSEEAKQQTNVAANDNHAMIAATQDAMEISSDAFAEEGISDGRTTSGSRVAHGPKDSCSPSISGSFDLNQSNPDSIIYTGTFVIDYGNGSTCSDSTRLRKGKITNDFTFTISKRSGGGWKTYASQALTFEGFQKDSTMIDGTVVTTSGSGHSTIIEAQDVKITFADGTSATWDGTLTYTYDKGESGKWKDNTIHVTGSWTGTNREGVAYTAAITDDLVFSYWCDKRHRFRPVSGKIEIKVGDVTSTVDYGDGTCDKKYTITSGGTTTEFEFDAKVKLNS